MSIKGIVPFATKRHLGLAAVAASALALAAVSPSPRPVMVPAGDDQMANCSIGVVSGLNPHGDGFLAVRSGPGTSYPLLDRIYNGQKVRMCDGAGDWVGIVYSGASLECATEGARPKGPYRGRCRSGWASGHWIKLLAG